MVNFEARDGRSGREIPQVEPVLSIRPHHFLRKDIKCALLNRAAPADLAEAEIPLLLFETLIMKMEDYRRDFFGSATEEEQGRITQALERYLADLGKLSDDQYVSLDPSPDGLCKSCIVGRHCTATNFAGDVSSQNPLAQESEIVEKEVGNLELFRYKEGVDFFRKPIVITLYDLGGRSFNSPEPGEARATMFNSLVVRVGPLRRIAKSTLDPLFYDQNNLKKIAETSRRLSRYAIANESE